jgi:hypothetical protein
MSMIDEAIFWHFWSSFSILSVLFLSENLAYGKVMVTLAWSSVKERNGKGVLFM